LAGSLLGSKANAKGAFRRSLKRGWFKWLRFEVPQPASPCRYYTSSLLLAPLRWLKSLNDSWLNPRSRICG